MLASLREESCVLSFRSQKIKTKIFESWDGAKNAPRDVVGAPASLFSRPRCLRLLHEGERKVLDRPAACFISVVLQTSKARERQMEKIVVLL